jgi:hypothetical protein
MLVDQRKTVSQAREQIGIGDQTYYCRRKIYGGVKVDPAKRLKELEAEAAGLERRSASAGMGARKTLPESAAPSRAADRALL